MTMIRLAAGLGAYQSSHGRDGISECRGFCAFENTIKLWKDYWPVNKKNSIRLHLFGDDDFTIFSLVERSLDHDCSDDRERIYAMYAIASDIAPALCERPTTLQEGADRAFLVRMNFDYSLDVRETYVNFAIGYMKSYSHYLSLQILEATLMRPHGRAPMDWPSWLPDWRMKREKRGAIYEGLLSKNGSDADTTFAGSLQNSINLSTVNYHDVRDLSMFPLPHDMKSSDFVPLDHVQVRRL